ncbi:MULTISPECIES: hypothetical protein [Stenotrophomonas]|uniref:hypothetical protein n=1 Tax=Stenotrophomonas TaxID=40323 RepID=UPI000A58C6ED|nr:MULTISPECIES: hypothetical protein [Stenotrophomonas]MBH1746298.1 hypothetical protein [Stenotrophomonas maltophilia]MBH1864521.1 hypothetical protein [Stenotrophomonas maltophilia]MDH1388261.1 hypothetical protein [Stenotrophomonas sp. GD03701]MDH1392960.1 hypothetical protein [Stenotrophomonas sp. GD03702]MDQ7304023.1 hypothetical protein [Stenotrophomonas sp. Sm0581]
MAALFHNAGCFQYQPAKWNIWCRAISGEVDPRHAWMDERRAAINAAGTTRVR